MSSRRYGPDDDEVIDSPVSLLQCAYLPLATYSQRAAHTFLGAVCFASPSTVLPHADGPHPFVRVPMSPLAGADMAYEVWSAEGQFTYGERNGVQYACNGDLLFGAVQLPETGAPANGKTPLQQASESAYKAIFSLIDVLDFPHLLRVWNYIGDINGHSHGLERYRQFNLGRQDGFLHYGRVVLGSVPAASALGFEEGPLTIYFFAGRWPAPIAIENPRQVSAYHYPKDYGPRSPTFSRASVARIGDHELLFISGTASIVGHRSMHVSDVVAQTHETLANIDALIAEANRVSRNRFSRNDLCYKVYVRRPEDLALVRDELRRSIGDSARVMFLRADICRDDLLMEIEASAGHPCEFALLD